MVKKVILRVIIIIIIINIINKTGTTYGALRRGKLRNNNKSTTSSQSDNVSRSVLPKRGDIAVLIEGGDEQQSRIAEIKIIEMLRTRGYRVVDEAKMKRIKAAAVRAQAARYALEGNVEGILRLNASYSAAATVIARIQAGKPVQNEFQLYTGTASAAVMAVVSRGIKLGGRTATSKKVAYTEEEVQYMALDEAIEKSMEDMF